MMYYGEGAVIFDDSDDKQKSKPKRKKTRLTRTDKYAIKKLKKAKGIKREGVVSAFGLSKARVRF